MFIVTVFVTRCWLCSSTSQHAVIYTLHSPPSVYCVT